MGSVMITQEQSQQMEKLLSSALVQAEADSVFLCDYAGNIINRVMTASQAGLEQTIAALASGSFVATNELAMLIGESQFHSVYHKGERASIYMQNLGREYIILVIFGSGTTVGLVKMYVERICEELGVLLGVVNNQAQVAVEGESFKLDENASLFGPGASAPSAR